MDSSDLTASVVSETAEATPSFKEQVDDLASKMTIDDKGIHHLPEGEYSEEVKYSATLEKRRRDTQSALSKQSLKLKAAETVKSKLIKQLVEKPVLELTKAEVVELDDLKYSDPEAWRRKMNEIEKSASTTLYDNLANYDTEASQQAEKEARIEILNDFNNTHGSHDMMTDEVFATELPKRFLDDLEQGKVSFESFLKKAHKYMTTPKKVGDVNKITKKPNLGEAGGGGKPSAEATGAEATALSYKKTTF